ncbi:MAG TPA: hypothetical protein VK966_09825 [Longimicrobiales bacterium]|nr:hypothetical protein [Longimicrobiales bacterium]
MKNDRSGEYMLAFVVGTLLGAGAALLLAPDPPTRRERVMKGLKPYRKKLRKKTTAARKQVNRGASSAAGYGDELVEAGREAIQDLRDEVADLIADARDEIAEAMDSQVDSARRALKKGRKRLRS